ncbi:iron ABC transporter ATP-binding protein [Phyllobacterium phragmitis]|uniref:Iron ABC transporter ATP-binding protein n=1 Tax=Phyllobacterium phragmitis TaxID=2670329 RepID=A0A2S9IWC7_9HYPH|nr:ABC transporter ATP-binding protein [Phyllobacterium phragmitis]PRD44831.1 iron ABC transporter ATP-binding protein [Phyllobacterium phragmitis]
MTALGLQIRQVAWGPSPGRRIIADVSFDVAPGAITAIVGANGAGKSTLLRCIYRTYRPQAGEVLLDGVDIWKMRPREAACKIAAVLQETPSDFPFTVREVIAMGRMPHLTGLFAASSRDEAIIETMIERLELERLADQPFAVISGGERQRALLARALVQQPGLLVLDEPTNHLDIRHQLEILHILRGLGVTVLTTLHDLTLAAAIADQIIVMRAGRVIAAGAPGEALTPSVIRSAFNVDATINGQDGEMRFAFRLPERSTP